MRKLNLLLDTAAIQKSPQEESRPPVEMGRQPRTQFLTQAGKKHPFLYGPAIIAVSHGSAGCRSSCSAGSCTCALPQSLESSSPAHGSTQPWCQSSSFPGHPLPRWGIADWCADTCVLPQKLQLLRWGTVLAEAAGAELSWGRWGL